MKNNLVKCPQCDLNFLSKEGMEKHQKRVHFPKENLPPKSTSFKCENCDEVFMSKLDFKKHKDPKKLLCRKCQEDKQKFVCENKCDLIKHVRRMHKKDLMMKKQNILESKKLERLQKKQAPKFAPRHQCSQCNKVFKDNHFLELHIKEDHSINQEIKKEVGFEREKRQYNKRTREATPAKNNIHEDSIVDDGEPTTPLQPPEPTNQFYYKTFTAEELIKLGVFNEMSPSLFVPPSLEEVQTQLDQQQQQQLQQQQQQSDMVNTIEPPNSLEGVFILGL